MATPTIAELQVNLNSRPITEGTTALNNFAEAAGKAKRAADGFNQGPAGGGGGGLAPEQETRKVKNLSEAIDAQTRKLNSLAEQRRKLEASGIKSTQPQEYERLNRIIDANIVRVGMQGDAVERLERSQQRTAEQKAARARQEERLQERLVEATVRQENVVTAAAARQARSIDQTINGLSRQIRAQNEYNATIEKLNKARDIGATVGGPGGISNGEYESYVKLAQARRDAALATEDNSRAVAASQSRLDTYIATLGRAERAEVQYSRAVAILQDNLQKGNITQEQYNQRIEQFASRRDRLVAAANSNAAAEERYARQLNQVLSAYDPVLRAQQQYNASVEILSQGLQSGTISVEQFNRALTQQVQALDNVKRANTGKTDIGDEYQKALSAVLPYRTELQNLELQQRRLNEAKSAGLVTTPAQIADYDRATQSIQRQTDSLRKRIAEGDRAGISYKQEQAALRGLPAQFTDIVVSLQGGQAPLTVLLQQGGQIKDLFGGIGPAFSGVARGLISIINPLSVAVTAFGALAIAGYQGSNEIVAFNRAITQSRNAVGLSVNEFSSLRNELESTGATSARAAQALTLIASNSNIAAGGVQEVANAAILLQRATGDALDKTIDDFASLGKEPVEAAVRLDAQYKFLTASVLAQADALVRQGKEQEAVLLLQTELASAVSETSKQIIDDAGYVERAWVAVKDAVVGVFDAIRNVGRDATPSDELADLLEKNAEISRLARGNEAALRRNGQYQENEDRIRQLRIRIDQEKQLADQQAANERTRRESVSAQAAINRRLESSLEGVAKAQNALEIAQRDAARVRAAGNVSAQQEADIVKDLANAQKKLDEAKEKANKPKRAGSIDTTNITDVKSNLSVINSEYEGYYKRVTALGEANVVSAEATYRSQVAILEAQKQAVSKSYDDQLAEINKLQENKNNSVAQNISLANQETKAEDAKAKALQDIDAKLDVLQTKENGRIQERTRNIAAYKAALESQLESLREQGAREADGVGRGDRNAALNQQLGQLDRQRDRAERELANSRSTMDTEEYNAKLRALTENHTKLKDQVVANDREIQRANYDWTNGFTSALENAEDQALNFADSTKSALEGAFNASGQALATFVTTGKFGFKDFASSVIADMARIAAQQAASGILSSILRFGVTAASAYFGGGAGNGLEAGSAGYNSSNLGASQAGYSSQYFQAQGGAWSGGTQYFANGGTFTNSVVSNRTPFGMANGSLGIMGEAGPEAIVPLTRTRNGDLGIRAEGFGGGGGGNMTVVNVNVQVNKEGNSSSSDGGTNYDQFGASLGQFVRQEIYTVINTETRPGGTLQTQSA